MIAKAARPFFRLAFPGQNNNNSRKPFQKPKAPAQVPMFDLPTHSAFVDELFSREEGERIPLLLTHLAAHLPEPEGRKNPAPVSPERLTSLASGLDVVVGAARAFLDDAAKAAKNKRPSAQTPLFFELAAALEAVRDVYRTILGSCREAVLAMARAQAAALRGKNAGPGAKAKAKRIRTAWSLFEEALKNQGPDEDALRAFFIASGELLALGVEDLIKARLIAPLSAQIGQFARGERAALAVSAELSARALLSGAGAASLAAKACRDPEHPMEAKILAAVDEAFAAQPPPPLRAFVADLAIEGHILERQAALVRELREKGGELEAARAKYRRAKRRGRKRALLAIATLGIRKPERFGDAKTLKLALDVMEEDYAVLVSESELSAGRPAVYLRACAAGLELLLGRVRQAAVRAAKEAGDPDAASRLPATLDRALGPSGRCSPDVSGFWAPVLAPLALGAAAKRCGQAVEALSKRNAAVFRDHLPPLALNAERIPSGVRLCVTTPDIGQTAFQKSPDDFLKEIETYRTGRFHSRKERAKAEALIKKFKGAAALLKAPAESLSEENQVKRAAMTARLPAIKMDLADGAIGLGALHRSEMRRVNLALLKEQADVFFAALEAKAAPEEAERLAKLKDILNYARTLASALPGMEAGEIVTRIRSEELLLGVENALTEPEPDLETADAEIRALFEAARSTLMSLDPAHLKLLMKQTPTLSRAINFLTGDQKRDSAARKSKK